MAIFRIFSPPDTIWQGRLRPRRGTIRDSRERPKAAESPTGKPKGIIIIVLTPVS
jgi:hypothetical protein